MSRLKRLIVEAHQRSLWQALAVYVGASLGVLGTVDLFIEYLGLPRWLIWLALSLLVTGLPVVIVISLAKEEVWGDEVPVEHAEAAAEEDRRLRFLTWRTAGFAFLGVLAVWGLSAAGWVVLGGTGYLFFRGAAAGFVEPADCVVVAEFENETERPATGLAVREAVVTDIGQSGYVTVLGDERLRETLSLMRLPDTTRVDQHLALEIALRDNCPVVVSGTVAPLGTGYILSARIVEASSGEEVVPLSDTAADGTEVVEAAQTLARYVRRHLGESLASIRRSEPLARVRTSSLEALEFYTQSLRHRSRHGDVEGSIPLMERAVALDTAFAAAYRSLWAQYGTAGDANAAQRNIELAYRFRERLTFEQRFLAVAGHHSDRGRLDSAIVYLRIITERCPKERCCGAGARNNLGEALSSSGRFEEALQVQLEAREIVLRCFGGRGYIRPTQVGRAARVLGRHALADSMLAILRERVPGSPYVPNEAASNAYYAGDLFLTDSLARVLADNPRARFARTGRLLLAGLASMYGHVNQALTLADSAAALELRSGPLWLIEHTLSAAGVPERALPYVESFRRQFILGTLGRTKHIRLGVIAYGYALAGELQSARDLLAVMDSLAEGNDYEPGGIGEKTVALIALQEERAEDAVEHLRRATAADYGLVSWDARLLLAEAHAALGHLDEAIAQYDTLTGTYRLHISDLYVSFPLRPLAHERLGSLYLEVGDTVAAARHLAEFIELWKDADPELQPRVEAARRRLAQLAAGETG